MATQDKESGASGTGRGRTENRNMKKSKQKTHLTPNEVAELLMVNPVTVRQWAARGLLRSQTTPGGHRRFLLSDVEEFARSRGATPVAFRLVSTTSGERAWRTSKGPKEDEASRPCCPWTFIFRCR